MRVIEGTLTDELTNLVGSNSVDKAQAYPIRTYRQLITQVAQLAYLNKDHLLFVGKPQITRIERAPPLFTRTYTAANTLRREKFIIDSIFLTKLQGSW